MMEHVNLDIADYIRIIILLVAFYFVTNAIESGYRLYWYYQDKKNSKINEDNKMEIRKLVVLMSPEERVQIVKDYIEFEKTGVLGKCLLRTVTENLESIENGYFIIRAMDIAHEVTLHIAKKLYSLDLEE